MRTSKSKRLLGEAFHEVSHDEPKVVAKTRSKKGAAAARRQKVAIALAKARTKGARISRK